VKRALTFAGCVAALFAASGAGAAAPRPTTPVVTGPSETEIREPVFRFRSRGAVRYECAFDATALRRCGARYSRRLGLGRHVLRVRGVGRTGFRSRVRAHVVVVLAPPLRFNFPGQIAVEPNGTVLVAESGGRLARIEPAAGTIATATPVQMPFGLATAPGVIYFSDDNAVRRIDTSGAISTVAQLPSDVGPLAIAGNGDVYAMTAGRVYRLAGGQAPAQPFAGSGVEGDGGDGGPALAAQIRAPHGLAVARDGALLISDTGNNRLRRVDPATRVITPLASIRNPYGVAIGPDGLVYVASVDEDRVLRIDATGVVSPFAVALESASSLAFDAAGTLYVTEGNTPSARIWRVGRDGSSSPLRGAAAVLARNNAAAAPPRVTLVSVGGEPRATAPLNVSVRIRGTARRVTIVAASAHGTRSAVARRSGTTGRARLVLPLPGDWRLSARVGKRTFALGTVDVRSAGADLVDVFRVALAPDGSLVIPNGRGNNVLRLRGGRLDVVAAMQFPIDATVAPNGDVYVVSANRVQRIDGSGTVSTVAGTGVEGYGGDGGPATAAQLDFPTGVAISPSGDIFITEVRGRVRRVDARTGLISTYAGVGHNASSGDGGPAVAAEIDRPHGLAVGPDGSVYVADTYGGRIRRIDPVTRTITSVVSGLTTLPVHAAVAPDGSLLVVEAQGAVVTRVGPAGARTSLIGRGIRGTAGDGGAASRALIEEPAGVAIAADGTIFVADLDARRVRRVDPAGRITTIAR
jgi:streptogramin lyase